MAEFVGLANPLSVTVRGRRLRERNAAIDPTARLPDERTRSWRDGNCVARPEQRRVSKLARTFRLTLGTLPQKCVARLLRRFERYWLEVDGAIELWLSMRL